MMRAIYFPAAGVDEEGAMARRDSIRYALLNHGAPDTIEVITSYEDIRTNKDSSWDTYCEEVVKRRGLASGSYYFTYFIFDEGRCGKATFQVLGNLSMAKRGKDAFVMRGDDLVPVAKVKNVGREYKDGWEVTGRNKEVSDEAR